MLRELSWNKIISEVEWNEKCIDWKLIQWTGIFEKNLNCQFRYIFKSYK